MNLYELLKSDNEPMPAWLEAISADQPFPRREFFGSRIVYYPGSGDDGHPVKLFGGTHSAHCFVYADYGIAAQVFFDELSDPSHPRHPRGYHALFVTALAQADLVPAGWRQHVDMPRAAAVTASSMARRQPGGAFALWTVLERTAEHGDAHGPKRLAVLVVGGDGIATYDALFCQDDALSTPYGVVVQDHGFGGNWTDFGGDSLLHRLAMERPPHWLLVADGTKPWPGYEGVSEPDRGGMHGSPRRLYRRLLSRRAV